MRIGFDAKRVFNNFTGLGNYSRSLILSLADAFPENEYILYTPKIKHRPETDAILADKRFKVITPHGLLRGALWRTLWVGHKLKKHGVEIFHGLSHEIPASTKVRGIYTLVTIHDVCFKTFPEMYHWWDRLIYNWKFSYACRHSDRIIAISQSTKDDLHHYYGVDPGKVDVIYQPVAAEYYTPIPYQKAWDLVHQTIEDLPSRFILNVGSINRRKNLMALIKAMELTPKEKRPFLLVVGKGRSYQQLCEAYIKQHGLSDDIRIVSNIRDNRVLQALYTVCQCFVYPSFYEGFGLPVVEAELQGTPVITSNVSSLPEAAGPDACLIDPNNPDALAQAIQDVLNNTDLRNTMIERGQEYCRRKFDPADLARQMMDAYMKLYAG